MVWIYYDLLTYLLLFVNQLITGGHPVDIDNAIPLQLISFITGGSKIPEFFFWVI